MLFNYFKKRKKIKCLNVKKTSNFKQTNVKNNNKKTIIIEKELKIIYDAIDKINKDSRIKCNKETLLKNSVCPKCSSTKIIDKISRIKGDIHGESSSYSSFNGQVSHNKIDGEIDTFAINKCSDCKNEWNKEVSNPFMIDYDFIAMQMHFIIKSEHKCVNCVFDSTDPTEKYSSLDEKIKSIRRSQGDGWLNDIMSLWVGMHIDSYKLYIKTNDFGGFCERNSKDWDIEAYKNLGLVEFTEEELNDIK